MASNYANIIGAEKVKIVKSIYPSRSGQVVSVKQERLNSIIFECNDSSEQHEFIEGESNMKYGYLKLLYNKDDENFALVEIIWPLTRDEFDRGVYYDKMNHQTRLTKIQLGCIVSLGVEIPSVLDQHPNRVNVSWKR